MAKSVTNKQQMAKLVELMEQNVDISLGICSKSHAKHRWEAFAVELNNLGPPFKSWEKWSKVWIDLKSKTKQKLHRNRQKIIAAGGDPNILTVLSPLEIGVEAILGRDLNMDMNEAERGPPIDEATAEPIDCKDFILGPPETITPDSPSARFSDGNLSNINRLKRTKPWTNGRSTRMRSTEFRNSEPFNFHMELTARLESIEDVLHQMCEQQAELIQIKREKLRILRENMKK